MPKKKLIHFRENLTFPHLFQPAYHELTSGFPLKGNWHDGFFHNGNPITIELGCGKGEYTVGLAQRYPDRNFIGIDWKGARLWRGCKTIQEERIGNAGFIRIMIGHIEQVFSPGEVSEIWITFPDPQVKKERLRLTSPGFLSHYRHILGDGGIIHLKTDDLFFYSYTLDVIRDQGHSLLYATDDLYHAAPGEDVTTIRTFYESMWLEMGKKICYLKFNLKAS